MLLYSFPYFWVWKAKYHNHFGLRFWCFDLRKQLKTPIFPDIICHNSWPNKIEQQLSYQMKANNTYYKNKTIYSMKHMLCSAVRIITKNCFNCENHPKRQFFFVYLLSYIMNQTWSIMILRWKMKANNTCTLGEYQYL